MRDSGDCGTHSGGRPVRVDHLPPRRHRAQGTDPGLRLPAARRPRRGAVVAEPGAALR